MAWKTSLRLFELPPSVRSAFYSAFAARQHGRCPGRNGQMLPNQFQWTSPPALGCSEGLHPWRSEKHRPLRRDNLRAPTHNCALSSAQRIASPLSLKRRIWSASVVGREPGIDATEAQPEGTETKSNTIVRIVDFSSEQMVQQEVRGNELETFLQRHEKPAWAACRWIYVNGLDSGTVQCLGRSKGLHRLALEDVLEKGTPVKADWYDNHCFMVLSLQKLETGDHLRHHHRDAEPAQTFRNSTHQNRIHGRANAKVYHFQQQPFAMDVEQAFMFLTTDNTVITIFEHSGEDIFAPIMRRLESPQTVMRSSNDPSLLVQGIIDTVVDLSIPIGKAVGDAFAELEEAVLTQLAISQSKQLYVLRSGLTILMDNISANGSVVRELISHRSVGSTRETTPSSTAAKNSAGVVISPMAQVYL